MKNKFYDNNNVITKCNSYVQNQIPFSNHELEELELDLEHLGICDGNDCE